MYDDVAPLTDEEKKLYENIEFDLDEYCKDVGVGQLLHDSKAGNWCFHLSKIEISGKLHGNPSSFKLYCSCLPVGTNPNAPLEIPISFSSWDWGSFCRNWSQDCDPPQGHWQILHPPRPWHGPQSCGEAGRPWNVFSLIFFSHSDFCFKFNDFAWVVDSLSHTFLEGILLLQQKFTK